MPAAAYLYALPYEYHEKYGIRRALRVPWRFPLLK